MAKGDPLFDLASDPGEKCDLAHEPPSMLEELKAAHARTAQQRRAAHRKRRALGFGDGAPRAATRHGDARASRLAIAVISVNV